MIFRRKRHDELQFVPLPRITPDPAQTAELERRRRDLRYRPEQGFLLERVQQRIERSRA